jgi:hypothetical protein
MGTESQTGVLTVSGFRVGTPDSVIRALTHTGKARDVFDRYRQYDWETYCNAVCCLRLGTDEAARVLSIVP